MDPEKYNLNVNECLHGYLEGLWGRNTDAGMLNNTHGAGAGGPEVDGYSAFSDCSHWMGEIDLLMLKGLAELAGALLDNNQ